jgi:predicted ATPase
MNLSQFEISNYRSIPSEELVLSDFNIFIGKNNAGKSNVINSLLSYQRLITNQAQPQEIHKNAVRRGQAGDPIEFRAAFELSPAEKDELLSNIVSRNSLTSEEYEQLKQNSAFSRFEHDLAVRRDGISRNTIRTNFFESSIELGTAALSGDQWNIERIDLDQLPTKARKRVTKHGKLKPTDVIPDTIEEYLVDEFKKWEIIAPFRRPSHEGSFGAETELKPSGENLTTVLHALRDDGTRRYERIKSRYCDIMEGVKDIRVSTEENSGGEPVPKIRVDEETSKGIALDEISSGSKEILILIEEPELHLHPAAEKEIYSLIANASDTGPQVIATTHSDVFVDEIDVNDIFSVKRDRWTRVESISADELGHELAALGYPKSEFLQADRVLFVEGRSDGVIFSNWASEIGHSFNDNGVSHLVFNGDEIFEEENPYSTVVPDVLSQLSIPYLYVFDSDGRDPDEKREEIVGKLSESPSNIHVLDRYCIESYFAASPRALAEVLDASEETIEASLPSDPSGSNLKSILDDLYKEHIGTGYNEEQNGATLSNKMRAHEIPNDMKDLLRKVTTMEGRN